MHQPANASAGDNYAGLSPPSFGGLPSFCVIQRSFLPARQHAGSNATRRRWDVGRAGPSKFHPDPPNVKGDKVSHRRSRPVSPPSMATMEADVDLRCIGQATHQLHELWPTLHDDDIALLALRGTALRQKLHETHPLDDRGRCRARACRSWWPWRRRSACLTYRILVDCGRAGMTTLWTYLFNPTGDRLYDERVNEWLRECVEVGKPPTSDPAPDCTVADLHDLPREVRGDHDPAAHRIADHSTPRT